MDQLYLIKNVGCDDETTGLARISDEDFPKFKQIIEDLNRNSTYGCMPTIDVYKIREDRVRKFSDIPLELRDGISEWQKIYLDDCAYVIEGASSLYLLEKEQVI